MGKGIGGNEGVWLKSLARTSFLGVCGKGEVARLSLHTERETRGSPNRAKLEGTLSPHARVHSKTHIQMRATHSNTHIHVPMQAHEYTHRHTQAHMRTHINIGEHKHIHLFKLMHAHVHPALSCTQGSQWPPGWLFQPHILEVSLHRVAAAFRNPWNRCGGVLWPFLRAGEFSSEVTPTVLAAQLGPGWQPGGPQDPVVGCGNLQFTLVGDRNPRLQLCVLQGWRSFQRLPTPAHSAHDLLTRPQGDTYGAQVHVGAKH